MPPKSKVEKSPHFNEILGMIKESISSRHISDYLKGEYKEIISHTAINNYRKKLRSKTAQEYHKKKKVSKSPVHEKKDKEEAIDEVVSKGVSDLDALDNIIREANDLELNLGNLKPKTYSDYVVTTEADIAKLKIQAKRLGIQAVNAKAKILKDEPETNININIEKEEKELNNLFKDEKKKLTDCNDSK